MRLQCILSRSGVASRRSAAGIVRDGRVRVNDKPVFLPGLKVDPEKDRIEVDGRALSFEKKVYYLFHKPENVVTTAKDPQGRRTVLDFFNKVPERVFSVGRLDRDTTGLLVMTNDGDLANGLMHPRREVSKRYAVLVTRLLSAEQMRKFRKGVSLDGEKTAPARIVDQGPAGSFRAYEVTIHEGKNRQIRRMMEILGVGVKALHRFEYGPVELGALKRGEYRRLSSAEIQALKACAGIDGAPEAARREPVRTPDDMP